MVVIQFVAGIGRRAGGKHPSGLQDLGQRILEAEGQDQFLGRGVEFAVQEGEENELKIRGEDSC